MKKLQRILAYSLVLILTFAIGYVVGSIRGSRLASLYGRILQMHLAYAVADAIRSGKSDIVFPDSRGVAHGIYPGVANDPWLHEKLLIPVIEWNSVYVSPDVSFGVNDAARHLTARVGQFLNDMESQSNKVAAAKGGSPRRCP